MVGRLYAGFLFSEHIRSSSYSECAPDLFRLFIIDMCVAFGVKFTPNTFTERGIQNMKHAFINERA